MITAKAKVSNPQDVQLEISLTMKVKDWGAVMTLLNESNQWPYWKLHSAIRQALLSVQKVVSESIDILE